MDCSNGQVTLHIHRLGQSLEMTYGEAATRAVLCGLHESAPSGEGETTRYRSLRDKRGMSGIQFVTDEKGPQGRCSDRLTKHAAGRLLGRFCLRVAPQGNFRPTEQDMLEGRRRKLCGKAAGKSEAQWSWGRGAGSGERRSADDRCLRPIQTTVAGLSRSAL
jgi:hypothetical protein